MSLVLVTLVATYHSGVTAEPMYGRVIIEPLHRRTETTDDVIYVADAESFPLDEDGSITATVATGNDSADPAYTYRITEQIGQVALPPYEVTIPVSTAGSVLNLADLQPSGTWDSADIIPGGFGGF